MQRGIDSYFKKLGPKRADPVVAKRKAVTISSDEEDSPKKECFQNKNKQNTKRQKSCSKIENENEQKILKVVDISEVFCGEASRESCRQDNELTIKNEHIEMSTQKVQTVEEEELSKKDQLNDSDNSKKIESFSSRGPRGNPDNAKNSDLENSILSDEERFERKRMSAVLYQKYKNRVSVINPGSKKIPKGNPNCLAGLSILVTGVLESIDRDEANSLIKDLGGKVSSTVGKRLNYLVAGEDPGPKKLADAEALGIPILNLEDFFNLINERSKKAVNSSEPIKPCCKNLTPPKRQQEDGSPKYKSKIKIECIGKFKEPTSKTEKHETKIDIKKSTVNQEIKKADEAAIEVKTTVIEERKKMDETIIAWVDKYKPTTIKHIIGQQGAASNCEKLTNWLKKWHTNQSGQKPNQKPNPWKKNDDGSAYKAALLSGPPGVGKTTTATLVCKELGYDIVEFNASDTRSKRLLKEEVSELLSNKSLYGYFYGNAQVVSKKHILIMDEVDGMAGNEDRGGIQELISLIKDTHVPIICMCNDRNHQKMRSLVNYCYDLRFNRPRLEQIRGFVKSICFKERLKLSSEKIDEIILATNNDIRQTVNHICLLSAGENLDIKSSSGKTAEKDLKMGPWEVVRKVFSEEDHKTMTLADKADLFFHDYSMAPLFVQQNYLSVCPSGPNSQVNNKMAKTADSLSLGDLVDRRIRSNSAWVLLPVQAVLSSVLPGEYMAGYFRGQINFPSWLGKYSRANKRSRLAQEIHDHTRVRSSGSRTSIRLDYAPFLLSSIVRPLKEDGLQGVEKSLHVLQEYRLLREDIDSLIELTTWPGKKNQMDSIEGRIKAALTRAYNKEVLPYSYSVGTAIKKKKMETIDEFEDQMKADEAAVVDSEEESDETLENDNLIKAKKTAKTATNTKASTAKMSSKSRKPKDDSKKRK